MHERRERMRIHTKSTSASNVYDDLIGLCWCIFIQFMPNLHMNFEYLYCVRIDSGACMYNNTRMCVATP